MSLALSKILDKISINQHCLSAGAPWVCGLKHESKDCLYLHPCKSVIRTRKSERYREQQQLLNLSNVLFEAANKLISNETEHWWGIGHANTKVERHVLAFSSAKMTSQRCNCVMNKIKKHSTDYSTSLFYIQPSAVRDGGKRC